MRDASEFEDVLKVKGVEVDGYRILRAESSSVPNAIASFLLYLRDRPARSRTPTLVGRKGNPLLYLLRFILFGEGDIAPVTREVLRQAEPDPERRLGHPCRGMTHLGTRAPEQEARTLVSIMSQALLPIPESHRGMLAAGQSLLPHVIRTPRAWEMGHRDLPNRVGLSHV